MTEFITTIKGRTTVLIFSFLVVMLSFTIYVFIQAEGIRKNYQDYKMRLHPLQINIFADAMGINGGQSLIYRALIVDENTLKNLINEQLSLQSSLKIESNTKITRSFKSYLDTLGITAEFENELKTAEQVQANLFDYKFKILHRMSDLLEAGNYDKISSDSLIKKVYLPEFEKTIGVFWSGYFSKLIGGFNDKAEQAGIKLNDRIKRLVTIVLIISILLAIIYSFLWNYFIKSLSKSIELPVKLLNQLSLGELPNEVAITNDELSALIISSNKLSENLRNATNFTVEIGKGNFRYDFNPLSEKDILGNALIEMKNDLESYSIKENQLNWANLGQAKFSEILRNTDRELNELCDELIKELVKYLKANLGGIYLFNESTKNLNLVSCYAFERKKFITKEIELGEGLLGQCYLEADKIHLTKIPENYISITSGTGASTPRSLLIVPIMANEAVVGIIELASFKDFLDYEIEFLEKICKSIASMVSTILRNNLTKKLLKDTTFASESLRAQEEEMRQNLEELHATQEEMQRKERQYLAEIANLKEKLTLRLDGSVQISVSEGLLN